MRLGEQTLRIPPAVRQARPRLAALRDQRVVVGIRPDHLSDAALQERSAEGAVLEGEVQLVEALGSELMVHFHIDAPRVQSDEVAAASADVEESSEFSAGATGLGTRSAGIARVEPRSQVRAGGTTRLAVDTERLYFFDPATGAAIRD